MRAEPRDYFFFLGGDFASFAGCFGAAFAPAFADEPFADGLDAEPLLGVFAAAFAGAFADALTGAFAADLAGAALATGFVTAAFTAGAGAGAGGGGAAAAGFTTGRGPPVRSENAPGRWGASSSGW